MRQTLTIGFLGLVCLGTGCVGPTTPDERRAMYEVTAASIGAVSEGIQTYRELELEKQRQRNARRMRQQLQYQYYSSPYYSNPYYSPYRGY